MRRWLAEVVVAGAVGLTSTVAPDVLMSLVPSHGIQ
jgi:hypothetical protein